MLKKPVSCFFLLILLPSLLVGGLTTYLLSHEKQRLENSQSELLNSRIQLLATDVALIIQDLRRPYVEQLPFINQTDREKTLSTWMRDDPMVRQVFRLDRNGQLTTPSPSVAMTEEESRFVLRYEALFSGRVPWDKPESEEDATTSQTDWDSNESSYRNRRPNPPSLSLRKSSSKLRGLSSLDSISTPTAQWISWFWENQPHTLIWATDPETGERYGLELETMNLLAELTPQLPTPEDGMTLVLKNSQGQILHQCGPADPTKPWDLQRTISLGATFPHWEITLIAPHGTQQAFAILLPFLYGAMTLILFLSIGTGAILLIREARRQRLDAEQKTSFVSNVSHELKTPLTTIRMYAELLKEGRIQDAEKQTDYLSTIVEESGRLGRLINNILDFSRLEQQTKRYTRSDVDLGDLLNDLLARQSLRLSQSGMTLQVSTPDHPVFLSTDRDAVEQTLLNLIDNAVKYASDGNQIRIRLETSEKTLQLHVEDDGPGIPKSHREKIFETFYRIDNSLTSHSSGSGLGLAISRKMMRELGGDLALTGPPPGAHFILTLPQTTRETS